MAEVQSLNVNGKNGVYHIFFREDKPDVMSISWNDTCIGMIKTDVEDREKFIEGAKQGKCFEELWEGLGTGAEPLDTMLPMEPYAVFIKKSGTTEISESFANLEDAQESALEYIEKCESEVTAYVCFLTGRYYRDGAVTCLNNIYSKGAPDLKIPFAKVLGMDLGVFDLIFKDKCAKNE